MTKDKSRLLKNFPYYIIPSDNTALASFINTNKTDMQEQVVSSIEHALDHNETIVEVFQFKDSQFVITLSESEFQSNLSHIYDQYMQGEKYELCPRIIKLLERLKRNINEKKQNPNIR